jgi:hypothetical protein
LESGNTSHDRSPEAGVARARGVGYSTERSPREADSSSAGQEITGLLVSEDKLVFTRTATCPYSDTGKGSPHSALL